MTANRDAATQTALDNLLAEYGFTPETQLYREALRQALTPTDSPGVYRLAANPSPGETVVDVYGEGHLVQAESVGPGLAFVETTSPDWQETMEMRVLLARRGPPDSAPLDRVEVAVRLQDVLGQGGLIYPVESVTVERAWYCTLPSGFIVAQEAT